MSDPLPREGTVMETPTLVHLALGSNVGDKVGNLREAARLLQRAGTIESYSSLYRTDPVGFAEQDWFLNAAISLETTRTPRQLLEAVIEIERELGRVRTVKNGPRSIDIDLLLWGQSTVDEPGLSVPHPRLPERLFVLAPLAEIAPLAMHPALGKSMASLRDSLSEAGGVEWFGEFPRP